MGCPIQNSVVAELLFECLNCSIRFVLLRYRATDDYSTHLYSDLGMLSVLLCKEKDICI